METNNERLDAATAARLAKLRAMPVDTASLDQSLRSTIPPQTTAPVRSWIRPLRAAAASILLLGAIAAVILISTSGGEVMASPAQMAQLHEEIVSGKSHVQRVDSIDAANKFLAAQWSPGAAPAVPGVPSEHVMACCMKSIKDKRVACVLLKGHSGDPVTLSVAKAADMKLPRGAPTVDRGGITYHLQGSDAVNMVTFERNGRWVCLIGKMPADQLVSLGSELKF
jgi:hypothetical protein